MSRVFESFSQVEQGPPDAILGIKTKFLADANPARVNVSVGAYRDSQGKPLLLNVVKKAEAIILNDETRNKEYLPIAGDAKFIAATQEFCFGKEAACVKENRVATVQALSGTGALRVGAEFVHTHFPGTVVYIPDPTWGNHFKIFGNAGLETRKYRYFDMKTKGLDFSGLIEDLKSAPAGSIVVLHVCSHNPTGVDPTEDQWREILAVVKSNKLLPFFDSAYQGFATGCVDKDAFAVRLFEAQCVEMFCAQSYSKNMGLYGERIGALNVVLRSPEAKPKVISQLELVVRAMYSNPPRHGAAIAALILTDPVLLAEWKVELKGMTDRIQSMRQGLREAIEKLETPGDWEFITSQIGMFAFTGLPKDKVEAMQKNHHIYMPMNGRISIAGVTDGNIPQIAKAIRSVL
eukprot:CAMPEP_0203758780 /NCGR_PEP_ID=MMETSP0098-20131031/11631_1 /ASSEMBLY_ACC=CAM_ASM_000208 /TAXON_ID=96639 /ORGANISM=" , Strain NY0313808BC1" /LENGTH=404 /DNA_ID=CAMNT_0050651375 /DNA_START=80 /DNA_END=1294 /DNA_ORIENTATION=-